MKTLVYITEDRRLFSKDFTELEGYAEVAITDPYLIVGIFENGLFLNPETNDLSDYDLKPIEKYLMLSTNVDFIINSAEFRIPNMPFLAGTIPPPIPNMFQNPLHIYATRSRTSFGGTEKISISVPMTGTVKLYIDGFEEKNLGVIESMPEVVPSDFDYAAWDAAHTFDVTDTELNVFDMSNISFEITIRGHVFYLTHDGHDYFYYRDNANSMGQITSVVKQWDEGFYANVVKVSIDWISQVDARSTNNFNFNYKRPGQTQFTTRSIILAGSERNLILMEEICHQIFGTYTLNPVLPVGTEFFFSDPLGEFTETNHKLII